jgi:predicted ATP-dependent endonuclease of OLD family
MIKKIKLENYRCFDKHEVEFSDLSVVVGKNNAGKSTLIEALRLIALVTNRYKNLVYKTPPNWTNLPIRNSGISPSLKGIEMYFKSIFYQYGDPPAKVTAYFQNKSKIVLSIGKDGDLYAVIYNNKGNVIKNKRESKQFSLPTINILPQIGPLKENEDLLTEDYVKSNIYSSLASSHFRNQLQYFEKYRRKFNTLTRETWHGMKIIEFCKGNRFHKEQPNLFVRDGNFTAEVGWMGHGVQIWLQTMWFIARCNNDSTIILDEPDVYLHADMQRKLI